jgi:hypothetical protein
MALESGNGRSSGKCPLTSNGYHLHSRLCCPHLTSFCNVSKKCYRCSRLLSRFRWRARSNQVTAVRAANARWHPTAITCTRDCAAPTWPLFAMFQKNVIVVVGCSAGSVDARARRSITKWWDGASFSSSSLLANCQRYQFLEEPEIYLRCSTLVVIFAPELGP